MHGRSVGHQVHDKMHRPALTLLKPQWLADGTQADVRKALRALQFSRTAESPPDR